MGCSVCGEEFTGTGSCPVCGNKVISFIGDASEEQKVLMEQKILQKRKELFGKFRIYVHGYNWEDKDGILVEHSQEDFPVGDTLEQMEIGSVTWGDTQFAKTGDGSPMEIGITIEENSNKRNIRSKVSIPETDGLWKVGVVLKPGLKAALRIGDEEKYADTDVFSLKG